MDNRFKFWFLCFSLSVKIVFSLNCFVTDDAELRRNINATLIIRNCTIYFDEFGLGLGHEANFSCATITIEKEKTNTNFQMCLGWNFTCNNWVGRSKLLGSLSFLDYFNATCVDCQSELCNGGVDQTITVKDSPYFVPMEYMLAGSFIIFGALVVVFLIFFLKKHKKRVKFSI